MMRTTVTLIFALVSLGFVTATTAGVNQQEQVARSFADLPNYIKVGDTVFLTDNTGKEIKARVEALGPTQIHLTHDGGPLVVSEDGVRQIHRQYSDSLIQGALIGVGIGGVLAIWTVQTEPPLGEITSGEAARGGAFLIGIGAGLGVGIDALVKGRKLVYYSGPADKPETRISIYPIVTRERKGLGVSVSF